jgi:7-keto-8-aminopelargonate synthetase-like enzyme
MRGDYAPFRELSMLVHKYRQLHLYLDDAHSTEWYGECGRGAALSSLPNIERVVVALSLNKSFSAAGGALAVATPELKQRIYLCGGTMLFSGPIQPPMLGAAVASVKLHLSQELPLLQADLRSKIEYARFAARQMGVTCIADHPTPIFFLQYSSAQSAGAAAKKFWEAGIYVCPVSFPAVPINMPGVRFCISRLNQTEDIDKLLTTAKLLQ